MLSIFALSKNIYMKKRLKLGRATSFDKLQDVTLLCIIYIQFHTVHIFGCICKGLS